MLHPYPPPGLRLLTPVSLSFKPADDGSCVPKIRGCTDSTAANFRSDANTDDGKCTYTVCGCSVPFALNYNALSNSFCGANMMSVCTFPSPGCMDSTAANYMSDANANSDWVAANPTNIFAALAAHGFLACPCQPRRAQAEPWPDPGFSHCCLKSARSTPEITQGSAAFFRPEWRP